MSQPHKFESNCDVICDKFEDMNLCEPLLRGIFDSGLKSPTPVQSHCIAPIATGRDVFFQAHSASGKATALVIGMLNRIDYNRKECQVLVLAGHAVQVERIRDIVSTLGKHMGVICHACVNNNDYRDNAKVDADEAGMTSGVHVVICTAPQAIEMMNRGVLLTNTLKMVLLHEIDEMVVFRNWGSKIQEILNSLPQNNTQVVVSVPGPNSSLLEFSRKLMRDPVIIYTVYEGITINNMHHLYIKVEQEEYKFDTLCDLLNSKMIAKAIAYCNDSSKVATLVNQLKSVDLAAQSLYPSMTEPELDTLIKEFLSGSTQVLLATDISLLSGHHLALQIPVIINYDLPVDKSFYWSRCGRRYGLGSSPKRIPISFVTDPEMPILKQFEESFYIRMDEMPADISGYF